MRHLSYILTASILILSISFLACQSPNDISGKLISDKGENITLYLIKPESLWDVSASYYGEIIDSAVVKANGSFEFKQLPDTEEPILLEIAMKISGKPATYLESEKIDQANYIPIVWQCGEAIEINANASEFQRSFSIEDPSEINQQILELRDVRQYAYDIYLNGKSWDIEDGEQLMDQEHSLLQYQNSLIDFADHSSHFLPSMLALRWVSPEMNYERIPEFLVRQSEKWIKLRGDHEWAHQLASESFPDDLPVLVGDEFPNAILPLISHDTIALHNHLGEKLTIIDLWASWCAPCRLENRNALVPIWDEYHSEGLQIIAYGLESDHSAWLSATERDGANRWIQASDLQGDDAALLKQIRVSTIPANYILDENGIILAKNVHGEALMDTVKYFINR